MKKSVKVITAAIAAAIGLGAGILSVQAQTCPVEGCMQTGKHEHYSCGVEGCTQTGKHEHYSCGVAGCTQMGEHEHYSCGVAGCTQTVEHTHNHNQERQQHHSGHRSGRHH